MLALIDGDIIAYRVGFSTEKEELAIALYRADTTVQTIIEMTRASDYEMFLSDALPNNFRFKIWNKYHANRTKPKPRWLEDIKEHLVTMHGATFAHGQEADDALGIRQTFFNENGEYQDYDYGESIICSNDKDLLQIEGLHYNIPSGITVRQSSWWGLNWFYQQILIGDKVDNIEGVRGIGKVWAERLLAHCKSEEELFTVVRDLYKDDERLLRNGRLLKIRTRVGEIWDFPKLKTIVAQSQSLDEKSLSTTAMPVDSTQSTEPITAERKIGCG